MSYMARVDPAASKPGATVAMLEVNFSPKTVEVLITQGDQFLGVGFETRESIRHVITMLEKAAEAAFGAPQ